MSTLEDCPIHIPSRADLRYVRSVLATVHERRASGEIERIAHLPIRYMLRFLAACRGLMFIFSSKEDTALYQLCGPTVDRVIDLANAVVDVSDIPLLQDTSPGVHRQWDITDERAIYLQDAIEQLTRTMALRRGIDFSLAWKIAGNAEVFFDQTPSQRHADAAKFIRRFVEYQLSTIPMHILAAKYINYTGCMG